MIINNNFSEDFRLAQKICKELLAENKNAIVELYQGFQQMFVLFARKRLYSNDVDQAESVLSNFWVELLNAKAICSYKAKASLKSYLMKILVRRIIDDNRSFQRQNLKQTNIEDDEKSILLKEDTKPSAEEDILNRDQKRIMQEALLMLEEVSLKDADLIRMQLQGLNYQQMAERQSIKPQVSDNEISKMVNSIKKQFTRKRTGSLAKFKICMSRCLEKHSLSYADMLN